jgi:hypothetical protein
LPGYENSKRPILISNFMPKNERKQMLNKIQTSQNQNYPYNIPPPSPGYPPYMLPPMFPRQMQNRGHKGNYRKPVQPPQQSQPIPNQISSNQNIANNREDEPNLEYLKSLENIEVQKDYLGEYLFKKIEQNPLSHSNNLSIETISKITGMILGIGDIKEIYDIAISNDNITARINEALALLENQ